MVACLLVGMQHSHSGIARGSYGLPTAFVNTAIPSQGIGQPHPDRSSITSITEDPAYGKLCSRSATLTIHGPTHATSEGAASQGLILHTPCSLSWNRGTTEVAF